MTFPNLTGRWQCIKPDGCGTYFIRQVGDEVFWLGEPDGSPPDPEWCNVAHGKISARILDLRWADVPKGKFRNEGALRFTASIRQDGCLFLLRINATGGFGGEELLGPKKRANINRA